MGLERMVPDDAGPAERHVLIAIEPEAGQHFPMLATHGMQELRLYKWEA